MSKTTSEALKELENAIMNLIDVICDIPARDIILWWGICILIYFIFGTFSVYVECIRILTSMLLLYYLIGKNYD